MTKKEAAKLLREQANEMQFSIEDFTMRDIDRWGANIAYIADELEKGKS